MTETEDYDKSATPALHHASHEDGGSDEVDVQGLAGELAEEQKSAWAKVTGKPATFPPAAHKTNHQAGGSDEINVDNLLGELCDEQKSTWAKVSGKPTTYPPESHHAAHEKGGSDPIAGFPSVTTTAWNKSIGPGGDYATWSAMIADMPNLIAHAVTVTIKAGTTLTETCDLKNKHGLTSAAAISIRAEKYFPTSGALPTADSATATTLRDAALATAALGNDYFNGCWVFVVDGTGTNNGFVPITDYIDATGDVIVASWPGTQPDNTSKYLIVGALVDCQGTQDYGFNWENNSVKLYLRGIGMDNADYAGLLSSQNFTTDIKYCGVYRSDRSGMYYVRNMHGLLKYCGVIGNNTDNDINHGGIGIQSANQLIVQYSGISDNSKYGICVLKGGYGEPYNNFGDGNGTWGTYAKDSGQAKCLGTECSGSSGNHSNGAGDGSLAY